MTKETKDESISEQKHQPNSKISLNVKVVFMLIALVSFQYTRMVAFEKVIGYFGKVDEERIQNNRQYWHDFGSVRELLISYTFIGYLILNFIIKLASSNKK